MCLPPRECCAKILRSHMDYVFYSLESDVNFKKMVQDIEDSVINILNDCRTYVQ